MPSRYMLCTPSLTVSTRCRSTFSVVETACRLRTNTGRRVRNRDVPRRGSRRHRPLHQGDHGAEGPQRPPSRPRCPRRPLRAPVRPGRDRSGTREIAPWEGTRGHPSPSAGRPAGGDGCVENRRTGRRVRPGPRTAGSSGTRRRRRSPTGGPSGTVRPYPASRGTHGARRRPAGGASSHCRRYGVPTRPLPREAHRVAARSASPRGTWAARRYQAS